MSTFRKKPVVIEAMRYDGTTATATPIIDWATSQGGTIVYWCAGPGECRDDAHVLRVSTLEGTMTASPGDWIIRGVKGEFYPCKPDIFEATYEPGASSGLDPETITTVLTERDLDALRVGSVVGDLGDTFFKHGDGDDLAGAGWVCECGERWTAAEIIDESDLSTLVILFDALREPKRDTLPGPSVAQVRRGTLDEAVGRIKALTPMTVGDRYVALVDAIRAVRAAEVVDPRGE